MDALELLKRMPSGSVNCIVTSPPYFGLRNYGVEGQIGLEETPQQFVSKLVELFREARRVLRDDGTCWVNLGDSYNSNDVGNTTSGIQGSRLASNPDYKAAHGYSTQKGRLPGLPPKSLLGIPWRLALAMQDDGWILRSDIIWNKPSCMPESVTDRPTKSHEYVFLFAKSQKYFYDMDAISEPCVGGDTSYPRGSNGTNTPNKGKRLTGGGFSEKYANQQLNHGGQSERKPYEKRNKRSVWTVNIEPFSGAHFATFPTKLIEPMILAGCPVGGVVLDPFMGSGTTALVARQHGRSYIGSELNPEYVAIARDRLRMPFEPLQAQHEHEAALDDLPLFAQKPA